MTGGYHIVDLQNVSLTSGTASTIGGIYDAIESNYYKPLLLEGVVIADEAKTASFINPEISGGNYTFDAYGGTFVITAADLVTYTVAS